MRRTLVSVVALAVVTAAVVSAATFKSTWVAPDAGQLNWSGKKVAAVVIAADAGVAQSGEEALSAELVNRGAVGVASYRMIPKEELTDPAKAKAWFDRSQVVGVVVMKVVASDKELVYTPTVWATATYSSFYSFYGTSYTAVRSYKTSVDTKVTIETLIYDVLRDKLIWAGVSETTNPKSERAVVRELATAVSAEMRKNGLVPIVR